MALPKDEPVTLRIVEALRDRLKVISRPTYYTSVHQVLLYDEEVQRAPGAPLICVVPESSSYDDDVFQNAGELSDDMSVMLVLVINQGNDAAKALLRFERDVKTALFTDVTLGGLAVNIDITGSTHTFPDDRDHLATSEVRLSVRYRTPRSDFNTAT
jgi:hypothetical protein